MTVLHQLVHNAAASAHRDFRCFLSLQKLQRRKQHRLIGASQFLNWRAFFVGRPGMRGLPGCLASFLRRWQKLGHPGLSPDLVALLGQIKLPGNAKGMAVATQDPVKGPFSDLELRALQQRLNPAFAAGHVSLDVFAACWLYLGLGLRPCQLAALKIGDYVPADPAAAQPALLQVPRAKQRSLCDRETFRWRKLGATLSTAVEAQATAAAALAKKRGVANLAPEDLPLFPDFALEPRLTAPGFTFHRQANSLSKELVKQLCALGVISERTKEPLRITPYRFRYTLGTRAARMGAGALVVAELLDHSDTQNVGVYVKTSAEAVERIDQALALSLAPTAQAFAGQLVCSESDATRGADPEARVYNPEASDKPLGSCGSYGWCGLWAGVACYTCRQFQPWRDGPHEQVLQWLLHQRENRRSKGAEAHMVMLHDQTILAVAEVVKSCTGEAAGDGGAS